MSDKRTSLTATSIDETAPLTSILSSASEQFALSWEDAPLVHSARYSLYLSATSLIATYSCPIVAWTERQDTAGDFVSGLWEYDVAELFIYSTETGHYQEFNIAPSGAWWSALFNGYRSQATTPFTAPQVEVLCHSSAQGWNSAIRIPLAELAIPSHPLESLRVNLCLIEGKAPRHYLSAAHIGTEQPDFHAFQYYLPVKKGEAIV